MSIFNINNLKQGVRTTICKIDPVGSISASKRSSGLIQLFYRYTHNDSNHYLLIGAYNPKAAPRSIEPTAAGYSMAAAKQAATLMAIKHQASLSSGGSGLAPDLKKAKAQRVARERDEVCIKSQTVEKLVNMYLATLKPCSQGNVRSTFKWIPAKTLKMVANSVEQEHWTDIFRAVAAEHPRTANKLRSFVMAAYNLALRAKADMSVAVGFKDFRIYVNPLKDTFPNALVGNGADKRPFSLLELQEYWQVIKNIEGFKGAALRIHLLTGGLRILQLLRLRRDDVDMASGMFTLFDEKGRRKQAAKYSTPIVPILVKDFELILGRIDGDCLFALQDGLQHIANTTLLTWAQDAVGEQIPNFTLKRIRSGVETLLASKDISKEIRGRLQSHGIGGIQDNHYDAHDYLPQKRRALEILIRAVTADNGKVIKLSSFSA